MFRELLMFMPVSFVNTILIYSRCVMGVSMSLINTILINRRSG